MADPHEPKKETVQVNLPGCPPPSADIKSEPNNLRPIPSAPVRPPLSIPPRPLPPSGDMSGKRPPAPPMARPPTPIRPPRASSPNPSPPGLKAPTPPQPAASRAPVAPPTPTAAPSKPTAPSFQPVAGDRGQRKETAPIGPPPYSSVKATVKLSPIQPPSAPSTGLIRTAPPPAGVANQPAPRLVDAVPMPFCWALLGISAVTLLIQLWTYFS
jgi:hypothetical protein